MHLVAGTQNSSNEKRHPFSTNIQILVIVDSLSKLGNTTGRLSKFILSSHLEPIGYQNDVQYLSAFVDILCVCVWYTWHCTYIMCMVLFYKTRQVHSRSIISTHLGSQTMMATPDKH